MRGKKSSLKEENIILAFKIFLIFFQTKKYKIKKYRRNKYKKSHELKLAKELTMVTMAPEIEII